MDQELQKLQVGLGQKYLSSPLLMHRDALSIFLIADPEVPYRFLKGVTATNCCGPFQRLVGDDAPGRSASATAVWCTEAQVKQRPLKVVCEF